MGMLSPREARRYHHRMPSPIARRYWLTTLLVAALAAFGYYALQPVREACAFTSGPYGSTFSPSRAQTSGADRCGQEHTRFMTWFGEGTR
ncbi:conserved hypothetical protein [Streptomyces sviceus ATCC 29083]|uniref:Uncharacterized protein n=2 Tax=Streptomyces TaxID=1883 RepID=B5HUV3_STRX2|nr:conserved hypothetical protein [Streptomyces sviceus ATCC 29083]